MGRLHMFEPVHGALSQMGRDLKLTGMGPQIWVPAVTVWCRDSGRNCDSLWGAHWGPPLCLGRSGQHLQPGSGVAGTARL